MMKIKDQGSEILKIIEKDATRTSHPHAALVGLIHLETLTADLLALIPCY